MRLPGFLPREVVQPIRFRHCVRYVPVFAAIFLWSVAASPAKAAPVLVQHVSKDGGNTLSSSLAFPASNTAGNWIGVVIRGGHAGQVFTVSDARGNTYKAAVQFNQTLDSPNGETLAIFYAENIAGGANTVTVSESIANNTLRFAILEYSGVATSGSIDVTAAGQGSGTTWNSGTATTTVGGDLILGEVTAADSRTFTAGSGYTIEEQVPASPNTKVIAEDAIQAVAGAVSVGATLSSSTNGGALLAAFKAASGTLPPSITSLTPNSGPVGTTVTITGTNFGASLGTSTVTFNGTSVGVNSWSATSIVTGVPTGATTGNVVVTVGGVASNGVPFTVVPPPPIISSLFPTLATVGTPVTISGSNFGTTQGTSTVTFNGTSAGVASGWNVSTITVNVPAGATTGNVVVTVGGQASNGIAFAVQPPPPSITSLNPTSGIVGTLVTISGANFGASQGTSSFVTFNGVPASPTSWSSTNISVPVPAGASTGPVLVGVGSQGSNGVVFYVVPNILSLNPASGVVGTPVNIAGGGFGASQGTSTVSFNGITAAPTSWSTNSITAPVPAGAGTGNIVVAVGGTGSNGASFTVLPSISSLNPSTGAVGSSVVINGNGFGVSQGTSTVTFNGTVATPTSWLPTYLAVTVPVGATTGNVVVTVGGVSSNGVTYTISPDTTPPTAPTNLTATAISAGQIDLSWTASTDNVGVTGYFIERCQGAGCTNFTQIASGNLNTGLSDFSVTFGTTYTYRVRATDAAGNLSAYSNTASATTLSTSMAANAGTTPQSATISTAFVNALAVTVKDSGGNPTSGMNVTFTAPPSGASGVFSNSTATITVATNASGVASAPFMANAMAGPYTVMAAATGLTTVYFSLTNNVGAPASMTANAGTTPQSTTNGVPFLNALAVTVKDAGSNPLSGVNVTFTAPGSGASGTFSNSTATIAVATNASGVASAPFTANTIVGGPYMVTASATGLTTVNFSLTNTAGAPSTVTPNPGTTPQSAAINTAFATPLAVTVKDASGNPVSGVNINYTSLGSASGGGASGVFNNGSTMITVATNASGVASAPFTANTIVGGPYMVTATTGGIFSNPGTTFSLTNTVGAPSTMTANAGTTPQSATTSTAFANALAVTVKDVGSNPVSGVNVTFTAPGSGASGVFSNSLTPTITVATNASGIASAAFTANATTGGPYTVTAAATGLTTVNFSLTNTAAAPSTMTANSGTTPQSATVSTAFATPLAVTVKDASSNPVSGVNVTFTAPGSGASGIFSNSTATITVATNASGVASASFTANATTGGPYTVTAAATGLTTVNFSLTNLAGTPTSMMANTGTTPQSAAVSTAFANALAVTVKDASSNPVSGVNVTFTAPGSGASGIFSNSTATITVATNSSGVASAPFTANAAVGGPYTVTANASGLTTVNFSLTNLGNPPPSITSLSPTLGPVGASVTIAGANFGGSQGTSTVTFNGVSAATASSWSASSITVIVPSGATTGNVVVTVGGQASNGSNFTVTVPAAPIALVQHTNKDAGTTTASSLAFQSNNTAANWIAVVIRAGRSGQVFTVSDSLHNTYRTAAQLNVTVDTPNGDTLGVFYAENIAGGANTITVSDTISGTLRFAIFEYSGVAPANSLDAATTNQGTSNSPNSGNATTTANGDLLLGSLVTANPATFTAGSGYKVEEFVPAEPNSKLIAEDQIQSAAGVTSAGATLSASDHWGAILAAFKAANGAAANSPTITSLSPTLGPVGTAVTITGTNFGAPQGTSTIAFNGASATPSSWSATTIIAPVPAGATTGTLVVTVGGVASNGVTFAVVSQPPSISGLSPSSAVAGSGPLTLMVTGTNFVPSSTVQWNGTARSTAFVSPTQLQATITAADVAKAGIAIVTVTNVSAGGPVSGTSTFFIGTNGGNNFAATVVNQAAQDIVYDPKNQLFYLSVPGTAATGPNTISVLDPAMGLIPSPQPAGTNPNALAISDDSQYLYAGIDGASSVQRFLLPSLAKDVSYGLGSGFLGPYFALDLQVAPGAPHTTAVSLGNSGVSPAAQGGVTIFDDASPRATTAPGNVNLFDSLQWGSDATALFAANYESSGFDFYTLTVSPSGVSLARDFANTFASYSNRIHFDPGTKLVYADDGHVINPATGQAVGQFMAAGPMVPDSTLNLAFFAKIGNGNTVTIQSLDLTHFTPVSSITVSGVNGLPKRLIRWGQNGLAFNTDAGQIVLIGGNFVH